MMRMVKWKWNAGRYEEDVKYKLSFFITIGNVHFFQQLQEHNTGQEKQRQVKQIRRNTKLE